VSCVGLKVFNPKKYSKACPHFVLSLRILYLSDYLPNYFEVIVLVFIFYVSISRKESTYKCFTYSIISIGLHKNVLSSNVYKCFHHFLFGSNLSKGQLIWAYCIVNTLIFSRVYLKVTISLCDWIINSM
jgi:hypothetical protein